MDIVIYTNMEEKILVELIKEENKWWRGKFEVAGYKERHIHKEISKFIKQRQIIALTGLRRVGKTTLMFKIIEEKIEKKFPKENIFYFSFDEFSDIRIRELIRLYENIINKDISEGNFVIVFDEIQKVMNWEEQLKRIYDNYPNIKFIISGSESLFIRKKSRESLAGRIFEFKMNPLSFKEYLIFRGKLFDNLILYREEILKEFKKYLICNGFPELIGKDRNFILKYIQQNIIEKIIFSDLPVIFEIKNISVLKSVFNIIYNNPGQIIEVQELAKEIGISRHTLSDYLEYLEKAFLIKKLYNFSKNIRKTERRLKKYYPTIINPYVINTDFSKAFENILVMELHAEFFYRDSFKNEVDIVQIKEGRKETLPIEIKSGKIKSRDIKPVKIFQKRFKSKKGIIISYDIKDTLNGIKIIPFYEYLLKK